jgi:hypothetical protein
MYANASKCKSVLLTDLHSGRRERLAMSVQAKLTGTPILPALLNLHF